MDHSLERLRAKLQPGQVGDLPQLNDFLAQFLAHVVAQPCMEPVSLSVHAPPGGPRIEGWLCYPAQLTALSALIESIPLDGIEVGVRVVPTVEVMPHPPEYPALALFSSIRRAVVGRARPCETSDAVHIWSAWDPIRPIHRQGDWTLCQASTGYLGWVEDRTLVLERETNLVPEEDTPRSSQSAQSLRRLAETALQFLDTPYLWGGTGFDGIDCSGFTAAVFQRQGLVLPRDAHQQLLGGRMVATHDTRLPLRTGDLLFFTHEDGRIGHVGLSLGGDKVIHAEEPKVRIISLNPEDPEFDAYRARHFVVAKRYLL